MVQVDKLISGFFFAVSIEMSAIGNCDDVLVTMTFGTLLKHIGCYKMDSQSQELLTSPT